MFTRQRIKTVGTLKDDCEAYIIHEEAVDRAKAKAKELDDTTIIRLSEIFKIMGDPTRLKIIHALSSGEMCVCDIAAALGMEHSAISHQLRLLRNTRVAKYRKQGKEAVYSLDDEHVLKLFSEGLEHARHG
ncbi:ArsR/SmtB family transcription factor [Methanocella conradii]|uniref:ArsR/SmtB family transcription factor n=1 Tax=Methanocella conradii TaxID=1175444 RepID=UPI00157D310B|nr:metalloregulator ArsR/SmtB family transcription factor [Methanocella conradii]